MSDQPGPTWKSLDELTTTDPLSDRPDERNRTSTRLETTDATTNSDLTVVVYDFREDEIIDEFDSSMAADVMDRDEIEDVKPEAIIGDEDERERVDDPKDSDYFHGQVDGIVQLSTFCSGTVVDEYHVLTAAHCIYDTDGGGWVDDVSVRPAADSYDEWTEVYPYSDIDVTLARTYTEYTEGELRRHDFALLTLDRSIGDYVSEWEYWSYDVGAEPYEDAINYVAGYPCDQEGYCPDNDDAFSKPYPSMWWDDGPGQGTHYIYDPTHTYELDTTGGQSGSPVIWYNEDFNVWEVIAVHGYGGSSANWGARVTHGKFSDLVDWIGQDHSETYIDEPENLPHFVHEDVQWTNEQDDWFTVDAPGEIVATESEIELEHRIRNVGTETAGSVEIGYYLSEHSNCEIPDGDWIATHSISPPDPFEAKDVTWDGTLSETHAGETGWICMMIDPTNQVTEFDQFDGQFDRHTSGTQIEVVEPAEFDVDITDISVDDGTVDVDYSVENVGGTDDTQSIEFDVDGATEETEWNVYITAGGVQHDSFSYDLAYGDDPSVDVAVRSDDNEDVETVDGIESRFDIEIGTSVDDGEVEVVYLVENTGDVPDVQDIVLIVEGSEADRHSDVFVDTGGHEETDTFDYDIQPGDAPSVSLEVETEDDSDGESVSIDEADFDVDITDTDDPIVEEDDVDIDIQVENLGDEPDAQTIALERSDIDQQCDSTTVSLEGEDTDEVELTCSTSSGDAPGFDVTAFSDDDSDSDSITVDEPPHFEIEVTDTTVEAGDLDVEYRVDNTGDVTGTQDVTFAVDGANEDTHHDVAIDAGDDETDTFTYGLEASDVGDLPIEVGTDDDADSRTVAIDEPDLSISITDTSVSNGVIAVDYAVENVGDVPAETDVSFAIEGGHETTHDDREVEADGEYSDSFEYELELGDESPVSVAVELDDDADDETVTLEPATVTTSITDTNDPVTAGEPIEVETTVENEGDEPTGATIELEAPDGSIADEQSVDLGGEETRSLTLEWETTVDDVGTDDLTVRSPDDVDETTVTVEQPPEYVVESVVTNDSIEEGETLTVEPTVINEGDVAGEENVSLAVEDEVVDERIDLALEPDEAETVSLEYETVHGDAPALDLTVETPHDAASETVPVDEMPFLAVETDETNAPVFVGDEIEVMVAVENTGDGETTQDVELFESGADDPIDVVEDVTLAGGETDSVTLRYDTDDGDVPSIDLTVASEDDEANTTATVDRPPHFALSDTEFPESVPAGFDIVAETTVTNEGTIAETQSVTLSVDDEVVESTDLTLDGGENESVALESKTPGDVGDDVTIRLSSDNESAESEVSIVEPGPPFVEITEYTLSETVAAGGPIEVTATVTNTGDLTAEQGIAFETAELNASTETSVALERHESETLTLSVPTDPDDAGQTVTATLASENELVAEPITIDDPIPATFSLDLVDVTETVEAGDPVAVTVAVTNEGTLAGTQPLELSADEDDTLVANESVTLSPGETDERTFAYETDEGDVGDVSIELTSENDSVSTAVSVDEADDGSPSLPPLPPAPGEPAIELVEVELHNGTVSVDDAVLIAVTLENRGDADGTVELPLAFDGETVTEETVAVEAGETETNILTAPIEQPGTVSVTVADEPAGTVEVTDPDDERTDDADDDSDSGTDDHTDDGAASDGTPDDTVTADDDDSFAVPGFGLGAAFLALFVATLVARRR
ncbi:trypsin-like serine protease [Halovivax gelatinilyticus]|uniref:trypsin-like serine protease n=1 Tax=Halovivax gelatinilyticus TaxID=2961597 RepID=UPI0020CA6A15|nr:trypsin-like serine protease [Halovivax gelatinilyticus]